MTPNVNKTAISIAENAAREGARNGLDVSALVKAISSAKMGRANTSQIALIMRVHAAHEHLKGGK